MNKIVEPRTAPRPTADEEALMIARAEQGLADVAAGRTMSVDEALARIAATPVKTSATD